jgi:hypothetical protein
LAARVVLVVVLDHAEEVSVLSVGLEDLVGLAV